jgi:hypothetical protein
MITFSFFSGVRYWHQRMGELQHFDSAVRLVSLVGLQIRMGEGLADSQMVDQNLQEARQVERTSELLVLLVYALALQQVNVERLVDGLVGQGHVLDDGPMAPVEGFVAALDMVAVLDAAGLVVPDLLPHFYVSLGQQ